MNNRKLSLKKNDEWYTPDVAWNNIWMYIPIGGTVFEPFFGEGHTYRWLEKSCMFDKVLGEKGLDFFSPKGQEYLKQSDVVITNPPFSIKFKILKTLVQNDKKFILLFPLASINTLSFLDALQNKTKNISIIIPKGRIKYIVNGLYGKPPSFETCYLFYKINTGSKLIFFN